MKRFKFTFLTILAAVFATIHLSSCSDSDPDGKWDPMQWVKESTYPEEEDGTYIVNAEGGVFTFECRNYSQLWIENANIDGGNYYPNREEDDYHNLTTYGFKANVKGNRLIVTFEPNRSGAARHIILTVTAGDIFYTFKFTQQSEPCF